MALSKHDYDLQQLPAVSQLLSELPSSVTELDVAIWYIDIDWDQDAVSSQLGPQLLSPPQLPQAAFDPLMLEESVKGDDIGCPTVLLQIAAEAARSKLQHLRSLQIRGPSVCLQSSRFAQWIQEHSQLTSLTLLVRVAEVQLVQRFWGEW